MTSARLSFVHSATSAAARAGVLWCALVVPSLFIVQKVSGWSGMRGYALAAAAAVATWQRWPMPRSDRAMFSLAAATFALVVVLFVSAYPRVNVHTPGAGSDDDDAQDLGAAALLHGRSPYVERTYLGNALHPLPGAFVLAGPFALIGASALQNLFWLSLFFAGIARETGNARDALRLAWLALLFSPTILHQVITGTSYASNTIYVLIGLFWLLSGDRPGRSRPMFYLAAAFWGIALASRANFLFLVPLAFGWLWRNDGPAVAVRGIAVTLGVTALLSAPFYVADPAAFGPLEAANRLTRFDVMIPGAAVAVLGGMAVLACWLAVRPISIGGLFAACALIQAVPVAAGTVLGSWQRGRPDLEYAAYGSFFAWFVLAALAWTGFCITHATREPVEMTNQRPQLDAHPYGP